MPEKHLKRITKITIDKMKENEVLLDKFVETLVKKSDKNAIILSILHGALKNPKLKKRLVKKYKELTRKSLKETGKESLIKKVKDLLK